jgi:hypothetical protein
MALSAQPSSAASASKRALVAIVAPVEVLEALVAQRAGLLLAARAEGISARDSQPRARGRQRALALERRRTPA